MEYPSRLPDHDFGHWLLREIHQPAGVLGYVHQMTAATSTANAEDQVRRYLLFLEDPDRLRDEKEIQRKTQAVLDAADPVEKLKALAELERVASIDEDPLRKGFVEHAKGWAEANAIPTAAFRELKVPDAVLREAGFDVPAARGRGRNGSTGDRQRAKPVPVEDIKAYVTELKGSFVLSDIMKGIGGSQATVRKAVDELVESGAIERLGPLPGYTGRGRAPVQYSRS